MKSLSGRWTTLVDLLQWRGFNEPEKVAYTFLENGDEVASQMTNAQLDLKAKTIAAYLQDQKLAGERILLVLPPGLEYISAFLGCLYTGAIAVPTYPPKSNSTRDRFDTIVVDSQPKLIITTAEYVPKIKRSLAFGSIPLMTIDMIPETGGTWYDPQVTGETLAFLQYTSGSVASPKGVKVNHNNLLSNQQMMQEAFGHSQDSILVGWLPLYHDMGLIGNVLQPLYVGFPAILMPPISFLQRPVRWLRAITKYRATTSGGPNFAFDLCVDRIMPEDQNELDLSSWNIAVNGSETVRASTLERFTGAFRKTGFQRRAFFPCYGLAEATLFVTGGSGGKVAEASVKELQQHNVNEPSQGEEVKSLVSCGYPSSALDVVIVDPNTLQSCSEGHVGEVLISGSSVTLGYWNKTDETGRTFKVYIEDGKGPYLRTGDLGFVKDRELYITGRLKEMIVIRGQNYYPQDIEASVEGSHTYIPANCCAAFSIEKDGEEKLVVVFEFYRDHHKLDIEGIIGQVRGVISLEHQLQVYAVVLVRVGTLPKTSSGKIQRILCKKMFLNSSLRALGEDFSSEVPSQLNPSGMNMDVDLTKLKGTSSKEQQSYLEGYLGQLVSIILKSEKVKINPDSRLMELGFDSLKIADLKQQIENRLSVSLPMEVFFQPVNISGLAQQVAVELDLSRFPAKAFYVEHRIPVTGQDSQEEFTPSFEQERVWYLNQLNKGGSQFNIPMVLEVSGNVDRELLENSVNKVLVLQESLRMIFAYSAKGLKAVVVPKMTIEVPLIEFRLDKSIKSKVDLDRYITKVLEESFDLIKGPLLRLVLIRLDHDSYYLVICMHHIISDLWSMNLFIKSTFQIYSGLLTGNDVVLPEPSVRYRDFADWQRSPQIVERLAPHLEYWKKHLAGLTTLTGLPRSRSLPHAKTFQCERYSFMMPLDVTENLEQYCKEKSVTVFTTLVAVLKTLIYCYTQQSEIVISAPTLGRKHLELKDTIGFFAYPLVLRTSFGGATTFSEILNRVRCVIVDAFSHQEVPFSRVVEGVANRLPKEARALFRMMLSFIDGPIGELELPGIKLHPVESDYGRPEIEFDFLFTFIRRRDGIIGIIDYANEFFTPTVVEEYVTEFQEILKACIGQADIDVSQIRSIVLSRSIEVRGGLR